MQRLFKENSEWTQWIQTLRRRTTIRKVEDDIAWALSRATIHGTEGRKITTFNQKVIEGIQQMARKLCEQEAQLIEQEIAEDLQRIKTLQQNAKN